MIIIIGNQKGGAGKSTLALLLANYLTQSKKRTVTVIDMDYQQSLVQKYEKAKVLENTEPYEVIAGDFEHFQGMAADMKARPDDIALIDLPGKLDDDGLIHVFKAADLVICPFSYDEFTFQSTVFFSLVLKKINPGVAVAFVPNRIKANVKYEIQRDVDEQLSYLGKVTPSIPDRIDFQRTNTFQIPLNVIPLVIPVFDRIYQEHINPEHE